MPLEGPLLRKRAMRTAPIGLIAVVVGYGFSTNSLNLLETFRVLTKLNVVCMLMHSVAQIAHVTPQRACQTSQVHRRLNVAPTGQEGCRQLRIMANAY